MGQLRNCWLEALSTCVTAVLVGLVYAVLSGYVADPPLSRHQMVVAGNAGAAQHAAAGPALR